MARVILDVPNDKMQPFLKAILNLGLDRHAISSNTPKRRLLSAQNRKILKHLSGSVLLFDWEFFSNELEYE
ncbi:hypothetical protein [Sediminibacterium goheungense]|uniref:Uncharacterized protein n=1 Tax=Sediminibacterium goheungense TaxID=1086393 RepID=A0A4R6IYP0_9BACT|nr:hypothetical protein [Sediminibacterium goheungense]TDO27076.1 hypothetical protein BC659_2394 [Sediminibacterium goheungense]